MNLPPNIKEIFFQTLFGSKSILEFEAWLYMDTQLETILTPEDYLDLIAYGYKDKAAKYGLLKLLENLIDKGEYETWRLLTLLHKTLKRDGELPEILMTFYDLYCDGYYFLDILGQSYGRTVEVPYPLAESWDELTVGQQQNLLNSFYPDIENEILKVIDWIESRKIILTGVRGEYNHYEFIDNRPLSTQYPNNTNIH